MITKKHEIAIKYLEGVCKGYSHSLIMKGEKGTGKTEIVFKTLEKLGFQEGVNYSYIANHITPKGLVNFLQKVNELEEPKIAILDDIDECLKNAQTIGVLKGALWEAGGIRRISWTSSREKINFIFGGRVVIILNKIRKTNSLIEALIDRGYFYEFNLTNKEMLNLMKERTKYPTKELYKKLTLKQRFKVFDFITKNSLGSEKLSLRSLELGFGLLLANPHHYQQLLLRQIR